MEKIKPIVVKILSTLTPLLFGFYTFNKIQTAGFPDSHVTEYDQAYKTTGLFLILCDICFSIFFLYKKTTANKSLFYGSLYLIFRILTILVLDWYLKNYLGLNSGQGG